MKLGAAPIGNVTGGATFPAVAFAQLPEVTDDFVCTVKRPSAASQDRVTWLLSGRVIVNVGCGGATGTGWLMTV